MHKARHFVLAAGLAAFGSLLACSSPARAIVNLTISEIPGAVRVDAEGSISGSPAALPLFGGCNQSGFLAGEFSVSGAAICTGPANVNLNVYAISGPPGFGGSGFLFPASSVSGPTFALFTPSYTVSPSYLLLESTYVFGTPFFSSATFSGQSLASLGFNSLGPAGTWTVNGTTDSINVTVKGAPGPLPLLGAGAAFSWSRRLRRRCAAPAAARTSA